MLIIQIPDNQERHKKATRRRLRALAYLIAALVIITAMIISLVKGGIFWYAVLVVETWWLWAVCTDPELK